MDNKELPQTVIELEPEDIVVEDVAEDHETPDLISALAYRRDPSGPYKYTRTQYPDGSPRTPLPRTQEEVDAVSARVATFLERRSRSIEPEHKGYYQPYLADELHKQASGVRSKRPQTIRHLSQVILKTRTDCNLRCTYPCYEYVDDTWKDLPAVMSDEVVQTTGRRMGEYALKHGLTTMEGIIHGGEPLYMAKPEAYYDRFVPLLKRAAKEVAPDLTIQMGMQTNGALLNTSILNVLKDHEVAINVSIDGNADAHNKHRVTKRGKGSHMLAMRGLSRLRTPEYQDLYSGILSVIDITNDPHEVYTALTELEPPSLDLLLPYGTWDSPPPQRVQDATETPYADWMLTIFDTWINDPKAPNIRFFSSIMQMVVGGRSSTEAIGPETAGEVVVRTDGSLELVDALKMTQEGAVGTNMNVHDNSLEEVAQLMRAGNQLGRKSLAETCMGCDIRDICGAGHITQRYSEERGFDNPSVYCPDLTKLISGIKTETEKRFRVALAEVHERNRRRRDPTITCTC